LSSVAAKLHGVAANYHQIAADAHRLVGSKEKAAEHAQQAGAHLAEAGKHAAVVADYAKGLSAKAEKSGKKSDHAAAWNAHQAAAEALHAAGQHKTAEAHEATAKGHQVAATQKWDLFAQLGHEAAAKGKIPAGAAGGPAKAKKKGKRAALENGDVEYRDLDAGGPDAAELLSRILAILRGLEIFFHSAHWQSRGPNFYGSHLMFERLYQSVADAIDALGERMVKHLGPDAVDAAALAQAAAAAVASWPADSALSGGLAAEIELQQAIRTAYDQLKAAGQLSPGMDDFLLSLADEHETNLYLLKQASAPEVQARYAGKDLSVETRNKPDQGRTPGENHETPTVEVLTRQLDLLELEHRCNIGTSYPLNGLAEEPKPTHNLMAMRAHGATDDCMRAKRQTGAPSRALELRAAAAHDLAASSAAAERKTAAAAFHTAMAGAHRAAADDQYAAEYQPDGPSYRSLGVRSGVERRDNPHHDEDGLFHSGLPHEILSAAAGRMQKAEARHAAAVGDEQAQPETRCELRDAHQASIAAAQDALEEADEAWGQLQEEHRASIAVSQGALEELGKNQALYGGQASTSPTPTDAHASDAPIE
jgi:DNA-binding ferritin-like protein